MKKPSNLPTPSSPSLFTKVWTIVNPAAGSDRQKARLKPILEHIQALALSHEVTYTAASGDSIRLVRERMKEGWSLIICAGGDGTINEVINGMMCDGMIGGAPATPLAILPAGTGNGLAREIGLSLNPWKAYSEILSGTVRPIYLGKVRERYFTLMGGIGFDAYVADAVEKRSKIFRRLPKLLVYLLFGAIALFRYPYPTLSFRVKGKIHQGSTGVVAKSKLLAGPFFSLSPKSDLASPTLTLCLLKATGPIGSLWTIVSLTFFGRAGRWIEYLEAEQIEAPVSAALIQADGEVIGPPPALFTLSEKPLYLVYPSNKPVR